MYLMQKTNRTNDEIINVLAPCGVYCGACPSYGKTCLGCASNDKTQKRGSKWGCKIRNCCYGSKELKYCIFCEQFPCKIHRNKLTDYHPNDLRFTYRHEIPDIFAKLKTMSIKKYLELQKQRWKCDSCRGTIRFYHYKCDTCGKDKVIKSK